MVRIIAIVLMLALLSTGSYAMNMGSAQKGSYALIDGDDSANFGLLFWNSDSETYFMVIEPKIYPDGWNVTADPSEFYLSRDMGDEYISLPYTSEDVMARLVKIYIKPSDGYPRGIYEVTLAARAGMPETKTSGMSIVSEKLFNFHVNISGQTEPAWHEFNPTSTEEEYTYQMPEEVEEGIDESDFFIAIILVAVMSIIIYKKYK